MKVTYISHSSFFVELPTCTLLFDYASGKIPSINNKPLYVFVSHGHYDHYNASAVEDLIKQGAHVILSDDITIDKTANVQYVHSNESYEVDDLHIDCLASTDEGVAFLVQVEDYTLYHAGDLHWWHWEKESTQKENEAMKQAYFKQLWRLKDQHIDVAFVPVDPRLEEAMYWGIDAFMKHVGATVVFPMHFWNDTTCMKALKALPMAQAYQEHIMEIHQEGEVFEL